MYVYCPCFRAAQHYQTNNKGYTYMCLMWRYFLNYIFINHIKIKAL